MLLEYFFNFIYDKSNPNKENAILKSNAQIVKMIRKNQFDSVRYASIERLKSNLIDAQSWLFLGQAMVGLKRGKMAKLCF
jgi:hypothetical protein